MTNVQITDTEIAALRQIFATICVRTRTGEIGIMHGANRFVSTQVCVKGQMVKDIQTVADKLGVRINKYEG